MTGKLRSDKTTRQLSLMIMTRRWMLVTLLFDATVVRCAYSSIAVRGSGGRLESSCHQELLLRRSILLRGGADEVNADGLSSTISYNEIPSGCSVSSDQDVSLDNQKQDHANPTTHTKGFERGKSLPKNFSVKDMFQAYRDIQSDYQAKAFSNAADHDKARRWELLNRRDDIEVSMLQHPSDPSCPYVRMRAVIPVPVEHCWNFLKVSEWDKSMPKMDPFYEGVSVYGDYSYSNADDGIGNHRMILCRKRTKRLVVYGKRDLVFLSVTQDDPEPDGTWVSGTVSVVCDHVLPRQKGYTRAFQDSIAFYKPIDDNTKTDLTIVCRIDLNDSGENGDGGFMPMWFYIKTIGRTGAMSIHRMREALIQELHQKQHSNK